MALAPIFLLKVSPDQACRHCHDSWAVLIMYHGSLGLTVYNGIASFPAKSRTIRTANQTLEDHNTKSKSILGAIA
jgi:hypothetical protein